MKLVQLSGAQKRKLSIKKQEKTLELELKTAKLTDFLTPFPQHNIQIPGQNQSPSSEVDTNSANTTLVTSESKYDDVRITKVSQAGSSGTCFINDLTLPVNSLDTDTSTVNVDSSYFTAHFEAQIIAENGSLVHNDDDGEIILHVKDEENHNLAKDSGLWLNFSANDVAYWIACGPSNCQHHTGPFDKSCRHFSTGKPIRYCSQKLFIGTKANGEK